VFSTRHKPTDAGFSSELTPSGSTLWFISSKTPELPANLAPL
jgi:hypothetical protein